MKKAMLTLPFLLLLINFQGSAQESAGKVFWRGKVDDKVRLVTQGDKLEQRTVSGNSEPDGVFSFTAPLPQQAATVSVLRLEGRSKKVTVVQQPSAENDFTAIVEIYDQGGGAREYRLEISWR